LPSLSIPATAFTGGSRIAEETSSPISPNSASTQLTHLTHIPLTSNARTTGLEFESTLLASSNTNLIELRAATHAWIHRPVSERVENDEGDFKPVIASSSATSSVHSHHSNHPDILRPGSRTSIARLNSEVSMRHLTAASVASLHDLINASMNQSDSIVDDSITQDLLMFRASQTSLADPTVDIIRARKISIPQELSQTGSIGSRSHSRSQSRQGSLDISRQTKPLEIKSSRLSVDSPASKSLSPPTLISQTTATSISNWAVDVDSSCSSGVEPVGTETPMTETSSFDQSNGNTQMGKIEGSVDENRHRSASSAESGEKGSQKEVKDQIPVQSTSPESMIVNKLPKEKTSGGKGLGWLFKKKGDSAGETKKLSKTSKKSSNA
jgi:hypothetical protein